VFNHGLRWYHIEKKILDKSDKYKYKNSLMILKDGKYYFLKNESKLDEIIKIELQVKSKIEQ